MKTIAEYLLMITSQYQNSPKFLEWLTAPLTICQDIHECSTNMPSMFDLDSATGVQLDVIGQHLGQTRTLPFNPTDGTAAYLDDGLYRKILKLKTMTNYWDGSLHAIYQSWGEIFTESSIIIVDNMNMTAKITLAGKMTQLLKDMIVNDLIIPRPEGVEYIFDTEIVPDTAAVFAYDMDSDYFKGYDESWWEGAFV